MQFTDLAAQQLRIKDKIDANIQKVLTHGKYILGPEVAELEERLIEYTGAPYCITCANGTDALQIALMAIGIKPGDEVITPALPTLPPLKPLRYWAGCRFMLTSSPRPTI